MCPVRARAPTPRPHRLLVYPRFPNDPRCLAPVPLFERSEGTAALATELTKQRAHGKWVLDRCSYYDANLGGVRGARVSQMRARAPPVMRAACLVLLAARSGRKRDLCPRFVKTCFVLHLYTKFARGDDARFMAARNERLQERTVTSSLMAPTASGHRGVRHAADWRRCASQMGQCGEHEQIGNQDGVLVCEANKVCVQFLRDSWLYCTSFVK